MAGCDSTDKVKALLRAMARAKIEEGHTDPDTILSHIHDAIKDHTPLERSEIADILVGHGGAAPKRSDLQKRVDEFYRELKKLQAGPKDVNALKNQARQRVIEKEIGKIQARIDAGDFRQAPPRETYLRTTATEQAQARLNDLREEFAKGQRKAEAANRSTAEKVADMVVELHRAAVLTSPNVLLKLPATALSNIALRPVLEGVGQGLRRIPGLSDIAAKAHGEGGAGGFFGTEGAALRETISKKTLSEMGKYGKTGTDTLSSLYGTKKPDDFHSDFALTQMIGNIHGMLKVPAKINQWTRSMQHRMASEANAMRKAKVPEDQIAAHFADPATKARIGAEAYADAEREIFQNKNVFSDAYSALLGRLHSAADKGSAGASAAEKTLRFFLPITKVPTNIGIAGASYAGGLLGATAHVLKAMQVGAKNMKAGKGVEGGLWKNAVNAITPEQADSVMRNLKRQGIGIAAMTLGAYIYKNLGGFYQQGDNKNPSKPEAETIDTHMRGLNIPILVQEGKVNKQILEHPVVSAMMMGATAAWVAHKKDYTAGALAAAKGLAEKNPFVREAGDIATAFSSSKQLGKFAGATVSSMNPQVVQWLARQTDRNAEGKLVKRKADTFTGQIEQGIPGLREKLPRSPNQ